MYTTPTQTIVAKLPVLRVSVRGGPEQILPHIPTKADSHEEGGERNVPDMIWSIFVQQLLELVKWTQCGYWAVCPRRRCRFRHAVRVLGGGFVARSFRYCGDFSTGSQKIRLFALLIGQCIRWILLRCVSVWSCFRPGGRRVRRSCRHPV